MDQKRLLILFVALLVGTLVGCSTPKEEPPIEFSTEETAPSSDSSAASSTLVEPPVPSDTTLPNNAGTELNLEQAKQIALTHAGVKEEEITQLHAKMDFDDGLLMIDVGFYYNNASYDYEIDGLTGEVVSYGREEKLSNSDGLGALSIEDASSLVLKKIPGATKDQLVIKPDTDDGLPIYEGTVVFEGKEYEFEINATTGIVTEWEVKS